MTRFRNSTSPTLRRASLLLFVGGLAALAILVAAACGGSTSETPEGASETPDVVSDGIVPDGSAGQDAVIKVYSSPT